MRQAHELKDALGNTPQTEFPIGKDNMVKNAAGGVVFKIDRWKRLERFLILGTAGGTYYTGERELTKDCIDLVTECVAVNGTKVVDIACNISDQGRAPKNDQAIFAMACVMAKGNEESRRQAHWRMGDVVRIPTHLFMLLEFLKLMDKGVSSGLKRAINRWYLDGRAEDLLYKVTKFKQRGGWSHRDVFRLAHPKTNHKLRNAILKMVTHPEKKDAVLDITKFSSDGASHKLAKYIELREAETEDQVVEILDKWNFTWEMLPDKFLNSEKVWSKLVEKGMPITATVRNLPKFTRLGIVKPLTSTLSKVCDRLQDEELLRKGRVHPIQLLIALKTYREGRSLRGSSTWMPVGDICDALNGAFYKAFNTLPKSRKRVYIGLDVSGSMSCEYVAGVPDLSAREGGAALCMALKRQYERSVIKSFSDRMVPLNLTASDSLTDVMIKTRGLPFGRTDCALPMLDAMNEGLEVDAFVVITDNESWAGDVHPYKALEDYRKKSGIDAKLIAVAMTAKEYSIADTGNYHRG